MSRQLQWHYLTIYAALQPDNNTNKDQKPCKKLKGEADMGLAIDITGVIPGILRLYTNKTP